MSGETVPTDDLVQPFQVESSHLRGRLVRMGPALDAILTRHDYPAAVATQLGELVVLTATIATMLKFDGILTLQTRTDGPIKLLVADYVAATRSVRGYAQYDSERLAALAQSGASLGRLLGTGHLAFTIDQGPDTERYQGIVEVVGTSLVDAVHHYFRQSEQIETGIRVAVARDGETGPWRGGAVMIQRLPEQDRGYQDEETRDDQFRHVMSLIATCRNDELTSATLTPAALLFRLFHEEGVRVFAPGTILDGCRCSEERVLSILASLPPEDRGDLEVDGKIEVRCEFCARLYRIAPERVTAEATAF
ncbi:molecular chaperone Hsp33 [Stella humosa]|uniref:Molecular chaperone Hsp33 n=1 Tax=Stella humosa TaxID=94 RepID=A0A3N1KWX2_9PROT|nr:molecular chaperone Hsp33 [Stella humosa]BBK33890.1 33 kDa chaperonin [Stella humosa]